MRDLAQSVEVLRFGPFEVDLRSQELRRRGIRIRLRGQSFDVLATLLSRPGELVTREELQRKLWPAESFGDFEHGLNAAVNRLREALSDSADQPRFIETLPRRGYRFVAPVERDRFGGPKSPLCTSGVPVESSTSPAVPDAERTSTHGIGQESELPIAGAEPSAEPDSTARHSQAVLPANVEGPPALPESHKTTWGVGPRWALLVLGVVMLVGLGIYLARKPVQAGPIHSLAVLPLENLSGDPNQEYFADGMTDELITELARVPDLRVVSRTSVMRDKGSKEPLRQIASELGVDAIVEGSAIRSGDRVRITAQLVDARSDRHLWAQSFEEETADALSLQGRVAREIAAQAKLALGPPRMEARRIDPAAHDAYLRGLYFLHKRDAVKSTAYFQQAISLDPAYAAAYASLSDALELQSWAGLVPSVALMRQAMAAARQAVNLDPGSGEAYSALGSLEMDYARDWVAAERDMRRGIALSPSYSIAELNYSTYLDAVHREEDAVTHMRRALTLDPLSFLMNRHLGSALYMARHYDEAMYYLQRASEMEPGTPQVVQNWVSWIYEKRGMHAEAVRADLLSLAEHKDKANLDSLRRAYEKGGWTAYQQARIDFFRHLAPSPCIPYEIGVSYLRLGNREQAFSGLNQAIDQYCLWMNWPKVNPLLDDIRTDPRFRDLLKRLNLSE
jgi:TolB-like protein/DNA-binding winged helix-turn-helix (wHTH) protein/Tfp pilus assembly protein PilF